MGPPPQVVGPADPSDLIMFYTAIYHDLMPPSTWTEDGGYYLAMDSEQVLQWPAGRARYTDLSIWDIFRSQVGYRCQKSIPPQPRRL